VANCRFLPAEAAEAAVDSPRGVTNGRAQQQESAAQLLLGLECLVKVKHALATAQHAVQGGIAELCADAPAVIRRFRTTVDGVVASLNAHRDSTIDQFIAVCAERAKVLQAQADELEVSASQVTACVAHGHAAVARTIPLGVDLALAMAQGMSVLRQTDIRMRVPTQLDIRMVSEPVLAAVAELSKLRLFEVDGRKTVVGGGGSVAFRPMAPNVFSVTCKDGFGLPAFWVTAADMVVNVSQVGGGPAGHLVHTNVSEPGEMEVTYVVDDAEVDEVVLSVGVCGASVAGGPWLVRAGCRAKGTHVDTLRISSSTGNAGLAISMDGSLMAVSNFEANKLAVYRVSDGTLVRTLGGPGAAAGRFNGPYRVCMTANDTVLVVETGNRRIQEVTLEGAHVQFIGVADLLGKPLSVAMCGNVVAVGKLGGTRGSCVQLFSYASGTLLRQFGNWVEEVGSIQFTSDGRHLVLALVGCVSLITTEGELVREFGVGTLGTFTLSAIWTCTDEVVVVDSGKHRVCVFSGDDGTLLRTWGTRGLIDGLFSHPTALTTRGDRLYVLDFWSARVQVFV